MRVYELARELGQSSADLIKRAEGLGMAIGNRLSGLGKEHVAALRKAVGARPAGQPAAPQVAKPKPPRPAGKPAAGKRSRPAAAPAVAHPAAPAPKAPAPAPKAPAPPKAPVAPPKVAPSPTARLTKEEEEAARQLARKRKPAGRGGSDGTEEELPSAPVLGRYIPPSSIPRFPRRGMRRGRGRMQRRPMAATPERPTSFDIQTPISVKDLSSAIGVKANLLLLKLMQGGAMITINATLDSEQVKALALELKLQLRVTEAATAETAIKEIEARADQPEQLVPRSPVVTFMGHVDHGKTSLLDRIRKTDVAAHEHGGITQQIGANRVTIGDKTVVFLDTPGHEAFTAMRARGANVTDIAVLVVAADDGVMPQTEEAIDHARAANVPIVVAVNKCDKPEANPLRVRQELANLGLQAEEWGGDTVVVDVSAVTGKGVDELIEMLALVAELRELKANPVKPARATVLDADMSGSRGPVAMALVQDGTLRIGDIIVCGGTFGRVKALYDDHNRSIKEAGPSWPVAVVGLGGLPEAGDRLIVLNDIQQARSIAEERQHKAREAATVKRQHVSLENLFTSIEHGRLRELLLILKGDVRGTLEALNKIMGEIQSPEVKLHILRASVGPVTTSDILLADASDAVIVGMNVPVDSAARALAEQKGVAIHTYNVIYRVKEEIEKALSGMLAPEERETIAGHVEVRRIFRISKVGLVAGCYVRDGVVARNHRARLIRDGAVVFDGRVGSLRRVKDDVREAREGLECGVRLEGFDDVKAGDVIETYQVEKIARTLGSAPIA